MTSRRPRVSTFADVYPVLDALIAAGGGFVDCGTPGRAVRWRQRGYQARAAFVRLEEERKSKDEHILYLERLLQGIEAGRVMRLTRSISRFLGRA